MTRSSWSLVSCVALMLACVGCDQATKALAAEHLAGRPPVLLLGGAFRLLYAENTGAFLSLGSGLPETLRLWIFVVVTGLVLALLLAYALTHRDTLRPWEMLALALVVGGGIGNLLDRVFLGLVRDFLFLGVGRLRTGVFNVADMAITGGALLMLLGLRRGRSASPPPT
ncbi:MAG TPA: signal peptidase II [Candidatus Polarisedimenticolaceae bacterium]|nr:signal peptidase II [Candidatus Polarisedimenticolaceae bacterium]